FDRLRAGASFTIWAWLARGKRPSHADDSNACPPPVRASMRFRPSISMMLVMLLALLVSAGQLVSHRVTSGVFEETIRLREFDKITTLGKVINDLIDDYGKKAQ